MVIDRWPDHPVRLSRALVQYQGTGTPSMAQGRGNARARPDMQIPVMLETSGFEDYALIDSGDGAKLERYRGRVSDREAGAASDVA